MLSMAMFAVKSRYWHVPSVGATGQRHDKPIFETKVANGTAFRVATRAETVTTRASWNKSCRYRHCVQGGDRRCIRPERRMIESTSANHSSWRQEPRHHLHKSIIATTMSPPALHPDWCPELKQYVHNQHRTHVGDRSCIMNSTCTGADSPTERASSKHRSHRQRCTQVDDKSCISNSTRTRAVSPTTCASSK